MNKEQIKKILQEGGELPENLSSDLRKYAGRVKGGLNRLKNSVRNSEGKYTSKREVEVLKRYAEDSGVTNWKRFYQQNQKEIDEFVFKNKFIQESVSDSRAFEVLSEKRKSFTAITQDGEFEMSKEEIEKMLIRMNNKLFSKYSCSGIQYGVLTDLKGNTKIPVIDFDSLDDDDIDEETLSEIAESIGLSIWFSGGTSKQRAKNINKRTGKKIRYNKK